MDKAAIDTAAFRFATLDRINHPMFVSGAACFHDVPALVLLAPPANSGLRARPTERA